MSDLPPLPDHFHKYSPKETHVKTYTAGEDQGRLADMAKEFGLARQRAPRKQVRSYNKAGSYYNNIMHLLHDHTVEDARMRAVWTSHGVLEEDDLVEEERKLYGRMVSWEEGLGGDVEEQDVHGGGMGSNLTSAVLGIIKGMVGPAILYLPHGFASAGYATAIPIMILATVLFLYSSTCLLDSWVLESGGGGTSFEEVEPLNNSNNSSYGGMATSIVSRKKKPKRHIMLSYPELAYRALGLRGESLVKTGIALMQSGVCLTYLIFVPHNLHTSMQLLFGWNVAPSYWLIVMIVIQVPLSWIRDIRKFTITNLLANGLILYGLLTCLGFAVNEATGDATENSFQAIWDRIAALSPFEDEWYLFIGTSVLLFEGSITLLVPLQEAVQGRENRAKFPNVYKRVILGVICFYAFFGIVCWMGFGNGVETVLTVSLPAGYLATSVQFAYSIAVVFTFPLQNFPALEIACRSIATALRSTRSIKPWYTRRNVVSSILVCLLAVVAVCTMNSLDKVVSLMGSLLGCPIAFVFPPLIHSRLDPNVSSKRKMTNYVVSAMGVLAMVAASFTTLATWNNKPDE